MTFAAGFIVNGTYVWREPPESESHPDRPETLGEREASGRIQAKSLEVATFLEVYRFSAHLLQLSERWDTVQMRHPRGCSGYSLDWATVIPNRLR